MSDTTHIFIIGNEEREPERMSYLTSYLTEQNLTATLFQPTYNNTLTKDDLDKYLSINWSLHNRSLRLSEVSLFLNFIYLFEKILNEYKSGYFLILESDVLFLNSLKLYLDKLIPVLQHNTIDCASIGMGCNLLPPNINIHSKEFQCVKMIKTRCTDALIFSYSGIQHFMNYFNYFLVMYGSINEPIDNFFETFFSKTPTYNYSWIYPSICIQGSQNGQYKSSIQES